MTLTVSLDRYMTTKRNEALIRNLDTFGQLIYGDKTYSEWEYVRRTVNEYSKGPTDGVANNQIRCYEKTPGDTSTKTLAVTAGSQIGFKADTVVGHPGPAAFYMAKVPSGQTAATWSGEGAVWFKIWDEQTEFTASGPVWPVSKGMPNTFGCC